MSRISMLSRIPTELFHHVFQYLTGYEILYAFKGLSKRVDAILGEYQQYDFDFHSWSKSKFDFVCQSISSNQIRSLVLSDAQDTCRQIPTFFRLFYIRHFVNLRSLSLLEISEQECRKFITELHFCPRLSSLTIRLVQGIIPKIEGLSLKHLSIGVCSVNVLQKIISCMPDLLTLTVQLVAGEIPMDKSVLVATKIRRLKFDLPEQSNINYDDIGMFLQCMPKLEEFTLIAVKGFRFIQGNRWEDLLRQYSPQLKRFHLKIHPNLINPNLDQLLSTFRTPFWLKEKQWIICCDHHNLSNSAHRYVRKVHLYTLPYSDQQFYLSLSTIGLGEVMKDEYADIPNLYLNHSDHGNRKLTDRYYFPNLRSLTIQNFHKFMPMDDLIDFSQLKHLTIEQHNPINSEEFFSYILVHAIHLQSLTLSWDALVKITRNFTDERVCSVLSKQIKYLNILNTKITNDESEVKRTERLIELFPDNLEKLDISVVSIDDIPLLLNQMVKLYSLGIECNAFDKQMTNEEMLSSLRRNVRRLKNFTHEIQMITKTRVRLAFWINCK